MLGKFSFLFCIPATNSVSPDVLLPKTSPGPVDIAEILLITPDESVGAIVGVGLLVGEAVGFGVFVGIGVPVGKLVWARDPSACG